MLAVGAATATVAACLELGASSSTIGTAVAPAAPTTSPATKTNFMIDPLMQNPVPADNFPKRVIGRRTGN